MSNSHGDLFIEVGKLVLAANSGQAIDLNETTKDLSERYRNLGISEETIANLVSRSIGAIGLGMARVATGGTQAVRDAIQVKAVVLSASKKPSKASPVVPAAEMTETPAAASKKGSRQAKVAATPEAAPSVANGAKQKPAPKVAAKAPAITAKNGGTIPPIAIVQMPNSAPKAEANPERVTVAQPKAAPEAPAKVPAAAAYALAIAPKGSATAKPAVAAAKPPADAKRDAGKSLFPSGVRLAVLS